MERQMLQEVLNQFRCDKSIAGTVPVFHLKALDKLSECRTAKLGGHAQYCENGHLNGVWYNSCKHRFCSRCSHLAKEQWIRNTQRVLLDCPHHHVVFTLPSELNVFWRYNRVLLSDLLFSSVQATIKKFSADPRYLNAMPGMLSTLHTWVRNLSLHPHLHVLLSHGGVNTEGLWVAPKKHHLFPQKPVMQVYRGIVLKRLIAAASAGELTLPEGFCRGRAINTFKHLYRKDWVVNFSERYDYAEGVAKYLGRYIKGGPLKESQVKSTSAQHVCFQYKSHKTQRIERLHLSAPDFVRRLLEHVPNAGKPSVRYGGLYVSSVRDKLNRAREQLGQVKVSARVTLDWETYMDDRGHRPECEVCGAFLSHKGPIPGLQ